MKFVGPCLGLVICENYSALRFPRLQSFFKAPLEVCNKNHKNNCMVLFKKKKCFYSLLYLCNL